MQSSKVVVIGDSYSSCSVFYYLEKYLTKTREPVDLLLISENGDYCLNELLPQYLTNSCDLSDISQEFRKVGFLKPGVGFLKTRVSNIDLNLKKIETSEGEIDYKYLVLALKKDLTCPSPLEIFELKKKIMRCLESKEILTFSIIGANKAGVELALSLSDYLNDLLKTQFTELKKSLLKINLIEEKNYIGREKDPFYNSCLFYNLNKKGITTYTNSIVTKTGNNKIQINNSTEISSRTIIFLTPGKSSSLIIDLPLKKDESGSALVDLYLKAEGFDDVFVIGETSKCIDLSEDLVQTILLLKKQAKICAANVIAKINNNPLKPMKNDILINFMFLGSRSSLVEVKGFYFNDFLGWLFHRLVYVYCFLGWKKKVKAFISLILDVFKLKDYSPLDLHELSKEKVVVKK